MYRLLTRQQQAEDHAVMNTVTEQAFGWRIGGPVQRTGMDVCVSEH